MKKFYWILVFIGITLQPQCKHGRTMDPLLIEAVQIQEDALKIARRYDSLIDEKWNETTDSIIRHELMTIQTKIKEWKKQRIEIPGYRRIIHCMITVSITIIILKTWALSRMKW